MKSNGAQDVSAHSLSQRLGAVLRRLREEKQLSLQQVATICENAEDENVKVTAGTLSRIETGQPKEHNLAFLEFLARVYGTELCDVIAQAQGRAFVAEATLNEQERRWLDSYQALQPSARGTFDEMLSRWLRLQGGS